MILVNLLQDQSSQNKYISNTLIKELNETLKKWKKAIIYINKKWEYSSLICENCKKIFQCKNCDSSLNIHWESMICHICWYSEKLKQKCDNCGSEKLLKVWVWTEQIEKALKNIFPKKYTFRFDTESVKNKTLKINSLETLSKAEIIIWTKMLTTGFDFDAIGLVTVILIEQELQIAKYNSEEKLYTNIKQLLWRWERKWEKTNFIIQSFIPENETIKMICEDNYKNFFIKSLKERKLFNYPPFCEYAILEYRNENKQKALDYSKNLKNKLDNLNTDKKIEIIFVENSFKKFNKFHYKIILKWQNLRYFLKNIKTEIFNNWNLSLIFE